MRGRKAFAGLFALIVVTSAFSVAAAAFVTGPSAINEDAGAAHNPYFDTDMTVAAHEMSWDDTEYENDQGELVTHPGTVNDTAANPYRVVPSDIEADAYTEFPRGNDTVDTWTNGSWWTEDESQTANSGTISEVETASGVEAIEVATSSQAAGDRYQATFDSVDITSDVPKRHLQLVADVDTLDAGATVEIYVNDSDGDYVNVSIDPDANADTGYTMANSTGEGYIYQKQIGEMTTRGTGDGTMDEIQEVSVHVVDADADVEIAGLNADTIGQWDFGNAERDWDNDDDNETESVQWKNSSGKLELTDRDTMGTVFSDATLHDLTMPVQVYSSDLSEEEDYERWNVTYGDAEQFANFDTRLDDYRRLALPSAFDLSYSNTELRDEVVVPDNRYQAVEYGSSVGETNFTQVSYSDATSSYSSLDDDVTLVSSGISAGEEYAVHYDYVVTADEVEQLQASTGGGAPMEDGSGGPLSGIMGWLAGIGAVVAGWLGLSKGGNEGS